VGEVGEGASVEDRRLANRLAEEWWVNHGFLTQGVRVPLALVEAFVAYGLLIRAEAQREEREAVVGWLKALGEVQKRAGTVAHHEYSALDIEAGRHRAKG